MFAVLFVVCGSSGEDLASSVTSPIAPAENINKDPEWKMLVQMRKRKVGASFDLRKTICG